jgi:hypothetical protein
MFEITTVVLCVNDGPSHDQLQASLTGLAAGRL